MLNIYAPAGTNLNDQRKRFFSQSVLAEVRKEKFIMVGDYNCVIHREDVEENYRNKRSLELGQLVQAFLYILW